MKQTTIDSHVHMLPYTSSKVDWKQIGLYSEIAKHRGIQALCLTEHRHAIGYDELLEGVFIKPRIPGRIIGDGVFCCSNGTVIFSGAEVSIEGGGDMGVHASPEFLISLSGEKAAYSARHLVNLLQSHLSPSWIVPHHVYSKNKAIKDLDEIASHLDAVEAPSKGLEMKSAYEELAARYGKPTIGSSDAHLWFQVGAGYTQLDTDVAELNSIASVKAAISTKNRGTSYHSTVSDLIAMSKIFRDAMETEANGST